MLFSHVFGNDSGYRDIQESRSYQGSDFSPLGFPLLAGAGAFTTLLSLRSEYAPVNIVVALILNMVWVYVVLKLTDRIERFLGKGGIYVIRKFFGIILLAISARLFTANLTLLIEQFQKAQ